MESSIESLNKKIEIVLNSAIPSLDILLKELKISHYSNIYIPIFIEAQNHKAKF